MAEGRWWSLGSGTEGLSAKRVAGTLSCEGSIPALTELCSSRAVSSHVNHTSEKLIFKSVLKKVRSVLAQNSPRDVKCCLGPVVDDVVGN